MEHRYGRSTVIYEMRNETLTVANICELEITF